ncbi:MAG: hypothetical protein R3Y59_04665 [bacterium]
MIDVDKHSLSGSDNYGWEEDKPRLVLYADFMGFKSLVENKSHSDLKQELDDFRILFKNRIKQFCGDENFRYAQFSDSILLVVNGVEEKMFKLLTSAAFCLMHVAMESRFPLKGAIAQGIFTYDKAKELYLGKPLVDAYLLHEQVKYYGIVVHNSAEQTVKNFSTRSLPYLNTKINIERGVVSHYHLCWNLLNENLEEANYTKQCKVWLEKISQQVSGFPRIYIDNTLEIFERDRGNVESLPNDRSNAVVVR